MLSEMLSTWAYCHKNIQPVQIRFERDRKINKTTRSFYVLLSQTERRQKLIDKIDFIDLKMKKAGN